MARILIEERMDETLTTTVVFQGEQVVFEYQRPRNLLVDGKVQWMPEKLAKELEQWRKLERIQNNKLQAEMGRMIRWNLYGHPWSRYSWRFNAERPDIFDGIGQFFATVYPDFHKPDYRHDLAAFAEYSSMSSPGLYPSVYHIRNRP